MNTIKNRIIVRQNGSESKSFSIGDRSFVAYKANYSNVENQELWSLHEYIRVSDGTLLKKLGRAYFKQKITCRKIFNQIGD